MKDKNSLENLPHIIVGTPGRIYSLLQEEEFENLFENVETLVIDEADQVKKIDSEMKNVLP